MAVLDPGWNIPRRFVLYEDEATPSLKVDEIASFLGEASGVPVKVKGDFLRACFRGDCEELAERIASNRVSDLAKPFVAAEPAYGEIAYELRLLEDPDKKAHGVLYDGERMMALIRDLIPAKERTTDVQHIVFTSRLVGTFGEDGRYHAHVNICGYPSIISTSGIVEAPAKPKEYYVLKRRFMEAGEAVPFELLNERFAKQFIDYDDPRLSEVLKGYALQCAMYAITNAPFCRNRGCRLFDAHWQSELIEAQLHGDRFCKKHREMLTAIRRASES